MSTFCLLLYCIIIINNVQKHIKKGEIFITDVEYILSAGLEFFFAVISFILLIGCLLDHDKHRPSNKVMIAILATHGVMNAVDACIWIWCDYPNLLGLMKVFSFLSYALGSITIVLFSLLLVMYLRENTTVPKWIDITIISTGIVMTIMWVISLFNGMYYYWNDEGVCLIGNLFWLSQAFGIMMFAFNIVLVIYYHKFLLKKDTAVLILYNVIPLLSFFLVYYWDVTPLYMATTIVLLLYYIIIHVEHGQRIAEQEATLVKKDLDLANSKTSIVLTQVRPHFLYNSLTAIAQLCEKDPKKAKETTLNFSEYLRQNMNSLNQNSPIPFETELKHVKNYLAIEQVRFGEDLRVVYDIGATDFMLPPLTIQPIVENAVKHGVGMSEDGGCVAISTRETKNYYVLTISDDGVGFDKNAQKVENDNGKHLGMQLVQIRLNIQVRGTMEVESQINKGTTVTISIPKDNE